MYPLNEDLQKAKKSLEEFKGLTIKILNYLPNVLSDYEEKNGYRIYKSEVAGNLKYLRPINSKLFVIDPVEFNKDAVKFTKTIKDIKKGIYRFSKEDMDNIQKILYTIQQAIGAALDLLVNPNSARKHVGNRFEELIRSLFTDLGIANKKLVVQIPYETDEGQKIYKCENDMILSPYNSVKSDNNNIDSKEIVVSIKTTSKDRMSKIFIDKILLEKFVKHRIKVLGIFLNDVQRKEKDNISYTLVSGLFMVYSKFLTELQGIYYLDPPPAVFKAPYSKYMKPFSELITKDIFTLLSS